MEYIAQLCLCCIQMIILLKLWLKKAILFMCIGFNRPQNRP
nr:MAG TPA: hypothetical protein [Caudoviricetes sp.]